MAMPIPMPKGMVMMPGLVGLTPPGGSFLPGAGVDPASLPNVRPSAVVQMRNGDTLDLSATLVRRTIAGRPYVMYGFNGEVPGPLIRVPQNATIAVRFHNRIDLPSSVHWHGVRLDNRFDGRRRRHAGAGRAGRQLRLSGSISRTRASTGTTRTCARTSSRRWACSAT